MLIAASFFESAKNALENGIFGILLIIDGVIYRFASILYAFFYKLASAQLLNNSVYEQLAQRIYLFVGIIALFALSVSLLKVLVNPEEIGKGLIKSFKTLVTSIILIVLMPTIFTYAYSIQGAIFENKIIDRIFNFKIDKDGEATDEGINSPDAYGQTVDDLCNLGSEAVTIAVGSEGSDGSNAKPIELNVASNTCYSNYMVLTALEGFFAPNNPNVHNELDTYYAVDSPDGMYTSARKYMVVTGNFNYLSTFSKNAVSEPEDNSVTYSPIISTAAGVFLCYIILSFCIDLGVRAAKLAFYEIIAPIPILMRLIPKKEGQFDKWVSQTVGCFLEVFIRVLIITFAMFMARNLVAIIDSIFSEESVRDLNLIGKAIIVLGLLTFAKQAPKLLQDALGIEGGNLSLGIKNKLTSVPIAGRAINAGYGAANKVRGAATGALGAGWTSKVNGGGFLAGAKYGAMKGFEKGGAQFNAQRKDIYNKGMGYTGTAGWFGGRNYMEYKTNKVTDAYSDNYKDHILAKKVYDEEHGARFMQIKRDQLYATTNADGETLANVNAQVSAISRERDGIRAELTNARNEFENNKQQRLAELQREYNNATDMAEKAGIFSEMRQLQGEEFDASSFNQRIADANARLSEASEKLDYWTKGTVEFKEYDPAQGKVVTKMISEAENAAIKAARREYGDLEPEYETVLSAHTKRIQEKATKEWLRTEEGQHMSAAFEKAYSNSGVEKKTDDKPAGPPPPPPGGGGGPKPS